MKASTPWITYRTRFRIEAKQLTTSLSYTDVLGRQHSGRKGDYLVESSDGVLRIAPRQIFEDIYVALSSDETPEQSHPQSASLCDEATRQNPASAFTLPFPLIRKSPQPYRDRRSLNSGLRSL